VGAQAHPQKFRYVENPGKILKHPGKIYANLGKICENLCQIPEILGKNGAQLWQNHMKTDFGGHLKRRPA